MRIEIELMHTKEAGLRYFLFVTGRNGERIAYFDISKHIKTLKCDKAVRDFISAFNDTDCRNVIYHLFNYLIYDKSGPFSDQFLYAIKKEPTR